jgi:hypothetical protein
MKKICITIALLLVSSASLATATQPLCVNSLDAMPEAWRPTAKVQKRLSAVPWSAREAEDAKNALATGVDEMLEHFAEHPAAVTDLGDDAVEPLIDVTYSGGTGSSAVDRAAEAGARRNLEILIAPYLKRDPKTARCDEFANLLPLAVYAHRFHPAGNARTAKIVAFTNAVYRKCGSFARAIDNDYPGVLEDKDLPPEDVFELVIWSIQLIEAELVPGLELPREAREFSPALWRYLESYPLIGAKAYKNGAWNKQFTEIAFLATHIVYIPTGYHRHPIYIEDSSRLYRFHRENFYPMLETGSVKLLGEVVDSLRQYGCTEENDLQVRDGTRELLKIFHEANDRWMSNRYPGETNANLDDYELIHKPWSGTIGIRPRVPEPSAPGTYGGVVRRWLRHAR